MKIINSMSIEICKDRNVQGYLYSEGDKHLAWISVNIEGYIFMFTV